MGFCHRQVLLWRILSYLVVSCDSMSQTNAKICVSEEEIIKNGMDMRKMKDEMAEVAEALQHAEHMYSSRENMEYWGERATALPEEKHERRREKKSLLRKKEAQLRHSPIVEFTLTGSSSRSAGEDGINRLDTGHYSDESDHEKVTIPENDPDVCTARELLCTPAPAESTCFKVGLLSAVEGSETCCKSSVNGKNSSHQHPSVSPYCCDWQGLLEYSPHPQVLPSMRRMTSDQPPGSALLEETAVERVERIQQEELDKDARDRQVKRGMLDDVIVLRMERLLRDGTTDGGPSDLYDGDINILIAAALGTKPKSPLPAAEEEFNAMFLSLLNS